jgi:mono/diheme cytochrome c family protein
VAQRPLDKQLPDPLDADLLPAPPFWMVAGFVTLVVLTWVPLAFVARARVVDKPLPRIHLFQDMDVQPKGHTQSASDVFADGRTMRPVIVGTVARGGLADDDHFYRGYRLVAGTGEGGSPTQRAKYFAGFPEQVKVDEAFVRRGQERFNIYCATCHGADGYGNGPTNQRALELQEPKWVPPTSLHSDTVRERAHGHLFNTITHGIRNMGGYGSQIAPEDRWAIIAYVRALQLSQNARVEDVPRERRESLR